MKRSFIKPWLLFALVLVLLAPAATAHAQGPDVGDKMVLGGQFTLESGETLAGDLVVLGGAARIERNSTVRGDVAVIGGSVTVDGRVEGDVAVIGGSLRLGPDAVVTGDAVNFGGSLHKDPDAQVGGDTVRGFGLEDGSGGIVIPSVPEVPRIPETPRIPELGHDFEPSRPGGFGGWLLNYFLRGVSAIVWATLLAALGVLLVILAPKHTERVTHTVETNTAVSFGAGCLTWVIGIPLAALLAITICLIPLSIVMVLALVLGWLFGWLALGWFIGKRLMAALKAQTSTPIIEIVVGAAILTLVWRMPLVVPFVGWLVFWGVGLIAGSIGLGAVFLTRFGTRDYTRNGRSGDDYPPPPLPETPPSSSDPDARSEPELEALPEPESVIELPPPGAPTE